MNPRQILLVDDSHLDREMALNALRKNHLSNEAVPLRDGAEALDYLYRCAEYAGRTGSDPALILLDLKMPRVDGLEVLRQIKGDPALKGVPVVMMTSSREEHDVIRSYQTGVNGYVVKPLSFQEFVAAIQALGAFWLGLNEPSPGHPASPPASAGSGGDA